MEQKKPPLFLTDKDEMFKVLKADPSKIDQVIEETARLLPDSGRKYTPKSEAARVEVYLKNKALRARMLENRIPFITPDFDPDFFLCQGLTIVAAKSGKSKSTTCANILAGFVTHCPGKQAVVMTNEEGPDAVIDRTACILHKKNYIDLYKGKMNPRDRKQVEETAIKLAASIEVIDDPQWDTTCLEDVQTVFEYAAKNAHLVALDYYQTVTHSKENPGLESFAVLKLLGLFLKDYGRRVGVPAVVFAQLKGENDTGSIADRVQNDRTVYNHCFNFLEVIPDFKTLLTKFVIHKGRFEYKQGKEVVMVFNNGRYEMGGEFDV